jgi:hypothetical protein
LAAGGLYGVNSEERRSRWDSHYRTEDPIGYPPADDPDVGEGVEDADPTDPTSISLTINNGTPQSYPFTKPDKIFIDFKK